jgi:hypothetical protein
MSRACCTCGEKGKNLHDSDPEIWRKWTRYWNFCVHKMLETWRITDELLASQEWLSPFYHICEYDVCHGMSRRKEAFLALLCCVRRHNKRNTLYLEFYDLVARRNTSRSLYKVPVFVVNRFFKQKFGVCPQIWAKLSCVRSRVPLFSGCWVIVCGQMDVQVHYCIVSYADQQNTGMCRITTFRSTTDRISDGGPIRWY